MLQYLFFKFLNKNVNQINKSGIKPTLVKVKYIFLQIQSLQSFHYSIILSISERTDKSLIDGNQTKSQGIGIESLSFPE